MVQLTGRRGGCGDFSVVLRVCLGMSLDGTGHPHTFYALISTPFLPIFVWFYGQMTLCGDKVKSAHLHIHQEVESFWVNDAQPSSNKRDIAREYEHLFFLFLAQRHMHVFTCVVLYDVCLHVVVLRRAASELSGRYIRPNVWNTHEIACTYDTNHDAWVKFQKQCPHLLPYISKSTMLKWKPFWL